MRPSKPDKVGKKSWPDLLGSLLAPSAFNTCELVAKMRLNSCKHDL